MKLERLLSIIFKLLNHEIVSASSLANEFQVSSRTIYRDIEAICAAGIPVVSFQGTNGGFGIIEGYKFDKSLMDPNDILNLISVLSSLSSIFEDKDVEHTLERLKMLDIGDKKSAFMIDLESYRTEPSSLMNLRQAIYERKVIYFNYVNNKNEFTSREVEPIHLHYKYCNWYLYGYCRVRKSHREFKVSRMMGITLSQEKYLQMHEYKSDSSYSRGHQERVQEVVIWVSPYSLAEALDQFQNSSKVMNSDGSMTFTFSVYQPLHAGWLKSILLSFGSEAKIIKPVELQSILVEEAKKLINIYKDV
ncbi:YafY family protein [Lysinibacillus fusiformis]|uniref:helix-turn-helix transcriptional regulator n=1 Tax=Lysinibacillus fusiformis TaxID=28031 RepID=UPI0000F37D92|nr:YafY family protein [Lysinibacillus fusiformis]EAZ87141.1 transcriptional regulator [Bacillus sp. B14905]MED4078076.1 YafY family protein [Lysinibacillus fusiformis]PCD83984.1 YafY family transcriptional regulator [Lysinibacillus fusiformis]